jgi:hypothetical protein
MGIIEPSELMIQNAVVDWLTLLFRIREAVGSNLGPETGYPEFFRDLCQFLQANARIVT